MYSLSTFGVQFRNRSYFIMTLNEHFWKMRGWYFTWNKIEYFFYSCFFYYFNKFFWIFEKFPLFLILILFFNQIFHFIFFNMVYKYFFLCEVYLYIKYRFNHFFIKSNFYTYLDRYFYSKFLLHCINIWSLNLNSRNIKNSNLLNNLEFFTYNYISIYILYIYFSKITVSNILKYKLKYIILNLYFNKFINSIFIGLYLYIFRNELYKKYIIKK